MDFLGRVYFTIIFRNDLNAQHSYKSYLTLFFGDTNFFMELQNIHKKERIDGIPVQNLPLFAAALMSMQSSF